MSAYPSPQALSFKADGAISRGMAVKAGSDKKHVAKSTAVSDKHFGIALSTVTTAEDVIDVSMGGGAPGLLGETVVAGDFLTADGAGKLIVADTANDHIIARALSGGDADQLIGVLVIHGNY